MSDKERLEEIKKNVLTSEFDLFGNAYISMPKGNFDWLLKQAERAEELKQDIKKIIKTADVIDERNQRYIKALEKIVNQAGINKEIDLELWKMAREALEGELK